MPKNIILPDDPEWKQPLVMGDAYKQALTPKLAAAKRAKELDAQRETEGGTFKYAASGVANHPDPWMKTAQMTGVSNMMTQPMWFSPLHTPQNWQIASKRREIYQWSYISDKYPCYLVNYGDFSLSDIKNVYTKWQNDLQSQGQMYIQKGQMYIQNTEMYIQNDKGERSQSDICFKRYVEKKANRIKIMGIPHPLEVTHDHKCIIVEREDVKCPKGIASTSKNCVPGVSSPTCIRAKCDKYKSVDYKISTVNAQDVRKGDYVLCPFPTEIKDSIIKTKEQARFAGHLASDGNVSQKGPGVRIFMHPDEEEYVLDSVAPVFQSFNAPVKPRLAKDGSLVVTVRSGKKAFHEFASSITKGVKENKRYTEEVLLLDPKLQLDVLGAYIQSDGSYNKINEQIEIVTVSKHLANQLQIMCYRCGIMAFCSKQKRNGKGRFKTKNEFYYMVCIPKTHVYTLQDYVPGKIPNCIYKPEKSIYNSDEESSHDDTLYSKNDKTIRRIHNRFFWKNYVVSPVTSNTSFDYKGNVYDIRVPPTYAITANGFAIHQCRFFYDNEPKVAAAIDFYSRFPMNGFKLECGSQKILDFFEHHVVKRLRLNENFKMISSEYFMLGDVFAHMDIECPQCFPARTMITAHNGHVAIEDVKVGDKVLTLDGSYQEVIATMSRKYEGNMIDLKMYYLPNITCTENHEIYAIRASYYEYGKDDKTRRCLDKKATNFSELVKIPAKNLREGDYVAVPIISKNNRYNSIIFDHSDYYLRNKDQRPTFNIQIDENLGTVLGWFVGEGSTDSNRTVSISLNGYTEQDIGKWLTQQIEETFGVKLQIQKHYQSSVLQLSGYNRALSAWLDEICGHGAENKKVPYFIFHASDSVKEMFISALCHADGHERRNEFSITTISKTLAYDLVHLLHILGHSAYISEKKAHTDKNNIHHRHTYTICWCKIRQRVGRGNVRNECYQFYRIREVNISKDTITVFNLTVNKNHNYVANGIYVANCSGSALDPETGETCNHEGGSFKKIRILNPDWIEVQQNVMSDEPSIVFVPDEELKRIVFYKQPKNVYERIPDPIKQLVLQNKPIPLSNRTTSHLKHMPVPYGTYGSSLIRRLFTTLAYKTKIMTANWIVAERLILPVRVVQIGSDNRPATSADIADIQQQLAATANDPNLTIVTHHNFTYEWYGACHDEETEVLTDDGFKTYDQVDITKDKIIGYNVYTKSLECIYATDKHEYDYDGEMIRFRGKQVDIKVTPNHKMLTKRSYSQQWKTKRADEIIANDCFLSHGLYVHKDKIPRYVYIQDHKIPVKKFLKYAGYYVSEGSITWDTKGRNYIVNIYQSPKVNPEICTDIESAAVSTGLRLCTVKTKNKNIYRIHKKALCEYMEENFGKGSHNKKLATWVKQLPPKYLHILLTSLNNGDGTTRSNQHTTQFVYTTISKTLADDVQEIALKCDYHVSIVPETYTPGKTIYKVRMSKGKWSKGHEPRIKDNHISRCHYKGKVWCFTVPTGFFVTRRNGKVTIQGNSGKILQVTNEMEYIGKEILDGFMLNQSLLNGEMSGYQSAQVGVETLIRRIESWRHTLADWAEENILKPVAEMQGFVDEEKSEEVGELCFMYPEIKWNDLNLKDKTQFHQLLNQLHDKQLISSQTLLEEMDLNYDQEVKRMRYEQTQAGPAGGALGGMPGAGMMPGGGGAGTPMGDMGMGMPGGDMGMGMPGGDMGGMGGGMPGGDMGMGAGTTGKIMKSGKEKSQQEQQGDPSMVPMIKLTSIEQKLADILMQLAPMYKLSPQDIRVQFPVQNPHGGPHYQLDFAIPKLKIDAESDGEAWHSNPEQAKDDQKRDYTLAQRGWTVLRFDDKIIEDAPQSVRNTIGTYIDKAMKQGKTASVEAPKFFTMVKGEPKDIGKEYNKYLKTKFSSSNFGNAPESFSSTNHKDK
ncbi:hypothetical protein LCGC14_0630460 [marine sediment metagenome]|uniref:DOD-type homing endonuclease domain-containing protein n=1 Tax=marine sediment metagenome TaxID=412755 RepID=A0A0F9RLK0_9ZZZZ